MKKFVLYLLIILLVSLFLCLGASADGSEATLIDCGDEILITGEGAASDGSTVVISKPGRYVLCGKLLDGQVLVKVRGGEVWLELAGFYGENREGAVLDLRQAASCRLILPEGSQNTLLSGSLESFGAMEGSGAALEASCDLSVEGGGALAIYGCLNNGLRCDGSLRLLDGSLTIQAAKEAVKAPEFSLQGGSLTATALNDGLEIEGGVELAGGNLTLRAARDGIDAGGSISLSGANVSIYTDSYAFPADTLAALPAGGAETVSVEEISFKVRMGYYRETDQYYALFYSDSGASVWVEVPFEKKGSQNMYYTLDAPAGFSEFIIYRYAEDQTPRSTELYDACTDRLSLGDKEIYTVSSVQDGHMAGAWSEQGGGGGMGGGWMSWGNANKRDYSCKGLKSAGNIEIHGGSLLIACGDDAVHAAGYVAVHGGASTLSAVDDGIHADGELYLNGGSIDILTAFEGLEGYNIYMNGGCVTGNCLDDGTNAGVYFVMTGGELDLTLPSGDTDGLDANYALYMTGGSICVRSAAYGGVAGTIDTGWGGASVKGGSLVSLGSTAEIPHSGEGMVNYVYFYQSFPVGRYTLENAAGEELLSFRSDDSYSGGFISSEHLALGESYQILRDGESYIRWTQEKARQTVRR